MTKLQTLKGFRDFLPKDARAREWLIDIIRSIFRGWGFEPLESPTLEYSDLFEGQIGEDEKLFFKFTDQGGRKVAMRYDQTVPTARIVAQYRNEIKLPFKRYQIGTVYRAEKPQAGRYREFLQADADIFGITSPIADAEVIALSLEIYRKIGFKNAQVLVNDRALLKNIPYKAIVSIDKLKKIGEDGVIREMEQKGIDINQAKEYLQIIKNIRPNETINVIFDYLKNMNFRQESYVFEPTIARSFAYSSGPIWEVVIPEYSAGSVLGGERYDNLIESISGVKIPATGFAVGFDRTLEAAKQLGLLLEKKHTAHVLVTVFNSNLINKSIDVAVNLREKGFKVDIYPSNDEKLGKQLKYADDKNIPSVIVIGDEEVKSGKYKLKNMKTGEQKDLSLQEIIDNV
ncbi:histidine--tRNA ligase [Candidatus Roizmanbacteria bacterium RIFCSPLOWO2_01_FULL_38_12]|uniref:Histidine--tRNA ligase n=1 Tax=Candidatus Roizmanbacteria bacterium RIFCSPLOWO2_01_FULL_38_12 TaxID=1802061 RepID=A0A1F7ITZ3_9BACT|nr:MAG: histidine--tRNA ligase [Candidatus Roizmanbacteria bacterium RIFCSPHIGHO2_01_FULL_38_15]OGK34848.1 MAG: histidine--tRNA ligase [Candidatus Roizmanbacteria bacterium RIFCSPHIGHO2_12_FULL_38_13]OGK46833.1 MAG: histidine--tRNA ligase [Candidatus Roizmanbacteria bacterium RIFCSPLOWO2_01_FULL_38_12]